ncbi:MAG: SufB/SufD family protein, partial [Wenzhouxiangellaceae bacterium]
NVVEGDSFDGLRREALKVLMRHGFPGRKTENWKYTPLGLLEKREFAELDAEIEWPAPPIPEPAGGVLHLHDGQLDPSRCRLPDGVTLTGLVSDDINLEALDANGAGDAFAWLNLARLEQGWSIRVDGDIDTPVALVSTFGRDFARAVHPRLKIELSESASITLIEVQHGEGAGLNNAVVDIDLAGGARLLHLIERVSGETALIQRSRVRVGADADYRAFVLDRGGRLNRQDLIVDLSAANARGAIHGAALLDGRALVDYHTAIHHHVGPSESEEDFRMLADDFAVGVFNGRIEIDRGADHSHSQMNTGNLLLSENARINTKPELEIHAEEVSASHGATVGQLDDMARFYLRSRGLSDAEASAMLKYGFAAAAFDALPSGEVADWLLSRLEQALN